MTERITLKRGKRPPPARVKRPSAKAAARRGHWGIAVFALAAAGMALFAAWLVDLPGRLRLAAANGVAEAGFAVRNVEVTGLRNMRRLPVYTAALDGASDSMLLVDLDEVRARLLLLPWVKDASVGRHLPDTLAIDVTERTPFAIWQYRGRHRLIDAEGVVLPTDSIARHARLPIVVGKGANTEAADLMALLADYPAVAKHVAGAVWIGERRWDLKLKSGETLALPDDYAEARAALANFVRIDRDSGLVAKGFARFDMRLADRLTVRLSKPPSTDAETARAEAAAPPPAAPVNQPIVGTEI
jgi:cell division protein FtsQ